MAMQFWWYLPSEIVSTINLTKRETNHLETLPPDPHFLSMDILNVAQNGKGGENIERICFCYWKFITFITPIDLYSTKINLVLLIVLQVYWQIPLFTNKYYPMGTRVRLGPQYIPGLS